MRDFSLEVYFSRWEFNCRYNLGGSDAENLSLAELVSLGTEQDQAAWHELSLGYTETYGSPELRGAIAHTYESVAPDQLLCFAGAEEAIYVVHRVLLEPEDHAIVITPNYQAAETIPLSMCEVTGVPLREDEGFRLDVDSIRKGIRPNTRLLSINFPNNPTGKIVPRSTFDAIVELCRERGIWLFSDEVYRLLERDASKRLPQAVDVYEKGISLNVMSKAYGLPGLRIGWLACRDRVLLARFEHYKHYLSICNSAPSELLARIALGARATILARNRAIIDANLMELSHFFRDHEELFDWRLPDGGAVSFVGYKGREGVETLARRLVEEAGVLLVPASVFRSELNRVPEDFFRIGFGHKNFADGLAAFRKWLKRGR